MTVSHKMNTTTLIVANQQLSFLQASFHFQILSDFFDVIKPACTRNIKKYGNLWNSKETKEKTPMVIYLIFKCMFDNLINNQINGSDSIRKILHKIGYYEIKPKNITKAFKYYEIKIQQSEEFLDNFFGPRFYQKLIKNKKDLESYHNLTNENLSNLLTEGYNDYKKLEKQTEFFLKNNQTNVIYDFSFANYILMLDEKKEFLKKITKFNINPSEKIIFIILIVITATKEKEKSYFGQTCDMVAREMEYEVQKKIKQQKKLMEILTNNRMMQLGLPIFQRGEKFSLVLESVMIQFVEEQENTLNTCVTTLSKADLKIMTKNIHKAKVAIYCIVSTIYAIMSNNTLYNESDN